MIKQNVLINKEPGASATGSFHKGGNRWLVWIMALLP